MAGSWCRNIKKLTLSLLILYGLTATLFSQDKNIGGVINVYRRITAIGPGANNVTLNRVDSLSVNDTILLIQMQGVAIDTDVDPYGAGVANLLGTPGGYEFLLIQSINTFTKEVVFKNNILTSFDIRGNVQLIRVPFYNSVKVTSTLTARPWSFDEKVGGVVAMIVGRKLRLEANIDVSFKGFYGGTDTIGLGLCVESNVLYSKDAYPRTWLNAGYKGEGLATHDALLNPLYPSLSKGQGRNFTGGGGGNGKFAGGGGGSNWGIGGEATPEKYSECPGTLYGGAGGSSINNPFTLNGIYFGGGGGSSTHYDGSTESHGGRGGGIVIIIADTLSGNVKLIKADGGSAPTAGNFGGGGGGGAGGSIIISRQSFTSGVNDSLKVSVKGGNSGASNGLHGNGGGGGGGIIWFNKSSIPGKVLTNVSYGGGEIGSSGIVNFDFSPKLNGFLFNSIRSDVTLNQVDSICSNMPFIKISGTIPVGGIAPHTFKWESSTTSGTSGFADAAGTFAQITAQDYLPGIITQTTWFRRTVTDANIIEPLIDISTAVKVIVHPFIKKNVVIPEDTICYGQNPPAFTSKEPLQDGNGKYAFKWAASIDNTAFTLPAGNTSEGYTPPPALTKTTWYRRTVTSGRCVDSSAIVKITVLKDIINNNIFSPQEICYGTNFANLTATTAPTLAEGDGVYRYRWETNLNSAGWVTAPGISNAAGYNPVEQPEKTPYNDNIFRRVVLSGNNDVCVSTSSTVTLKDFPTIKGNTISSILPICSGSTPPILVGSGTPVLKGGNEAFTYVWQDSSKARPAWTPIAGATAEDYQPPVLTDTIRYRRIVTSTLLTSACSDISKSVMVVVHKPISNNIVTRNAGGADTIICTGGQVELLKGTIPKGGTDILGDYTFQWVKSPDNSTWSDISPGGTTQSFTPPVLSTTGTPLIQYYKRRVSSGSCLNSLSASRIKVTVLPVISNNTITIPSKVCYNTIPVPLNTPALTGGAGPGTYVYTWEQSTNSGATWIAAVGVTNTTTGSLQPPALTTETMYRRTVKSLGFECLLNTSAPVTIGINPLPTASITSTTPLVICYPGTTVPLDINITGIASPWKVILKENTTAGSVNTVITNSATLTVTPTTTTGLSSYSYTYTLGSVEDANGCLATSLLNSRPVTVYKTPVPNAGLDADTCGLVYKLRAIPTVGIGSWTNPASVTPLTSTTAKTTVTLSPFTGSNAEYWFVWKENNFGCAGKDSVKVRFDKAITSIDAAGRDTTLFTFTNIIYLNAKPLEAWETGTWALESGEGSISDLSLASSSISGLAAGVNTFSWTIKNGSCSLKDLIDISVYDIVVPEGFSPNADGVNDILLVKGLDLNSQTAEMTIVNGAGSVVFLTTSQDWKDWDGKDSRGKDVSEGTYFYILRLTSTDPQSLKKEKKLSGFVILKRY